MGEKEQKKNAGRFVWEWIFISKHLKLLKFNEHFISSNCTRLNVKSEKLVPNPYKHLDIHSTTLFTALYFLVFLYILSLNARVETRENKTPAQNGKETEINRKTVDIFGKK